MLAEELAEFGRARRAARRSSETGAAEGIAGAATWSLDARRASARRSPRPRREDERILRGRTRYVDDIAPDGAAAHRLRAQPARAGEDPRRSTGRPSHHRRRPRRSRASGPAGRAAGRRGRGRRPSDPRRRTRSATSASRSPRSSPRRAPRPRTRSSWSTSTTSRSTAEPEELLRWRKVGGDVEAAFAAAAHVVRTRHVIPRAVAAPIEPRGCVAQAEGDAPARVAVGAGHPPAARRPRPCARPAAGVDPRHARRHRRRVRQQGPAGAGGRGRGGRGDRPRPARQVGRDRAARTSSPPTRGAASRARSSWRWTATGGCSASARGWSADTGAYLHAGDRGPAAHHGHADDRRLRHRRRRHRGRRRADRPGADRPDARRRPARGLLTCSSAPSTRPRASSGSTRSSCGGATSSPTFPYETPLGFTYDSGDYEQCLDRALELVGEPPPGAGLGIALYVERAGGQWESAEMDARATTAA